MLQGVSAIVGVAATLLLAVLAVAGRALTPLAGVVSAMFGIVIVLFAGFPYLALLALFVVASALATRYRFDEKKLQKLQEGRSGERGVSNVVAHIVIPTGIAVAGGVAPPAIPANLTGLLFASALSFGAADTFASEFGVLAGHARGILSRESVPPGTNGGVSATGQLFALIGAGMTSVVALLLFWAFRAPLPEVVLFVPTVTIVGFVGCQVDSVLGELYENDGRLSKGSTNFLGMLSAVAMAGAIFALSGAIL